MLSFSVNVSGLGQVLVIHIAETDDDLNVHQAYQDVFRSVAHLSSQLPPCQLFMQIERARMKTTIVTTTR